MSLRHCVNQNHIHKRNNHCPRNLCPRILPLHPSSERMNHLFLCAHRRHHRWSIQIRKRVRFINRTNIPMVVEPLPLRDTQGTSTTRTRRHQVGVVGDEVHQALVQGDEEEQEDVACVVPRNNLSRGHPNNTITCLAITQCRIICRAREPYSTTFNNNNNSNNDPDLRRVRKRFCRLLTPRPTNRLKRSSLGSGVG